MKATSCPHIEQRPENDFLGYVDKHDNPRFSCPTCLANDAKELLKVHTAREIVDNFEASNMTESGYHWLITQLLQRLSDAYSKVEKRPQTKSRLTPQEKAVRAQERYEKLRRNRLAQRDFVHSALLKRKALEARGAAHV